MISTQIEQLVLNSQCAVWMNIKSINFGCSPKTLKGCKVVSVEWLYYGSSGERRFGEQARRLFEHMLQETCAHNNTEIDTSGGLSYGAQDISDTIQERLFCLDCGKDLEDG